MQDYTHNFFGTWGFLLIEEKVYLVSHCHVKKALKIVIFFFQQIFVNFFFFSLIFFFKYKQLKIYEDSYFSFF